jgi:glycosyltransferase involved in cell wall biosynthesis
LRAIPLFFWGYYWAKKSNADIIEAESPIISGPASVILGKVLKLPSVIEVRATYSELVKIKLHWLPTAFKKFALNAVYKYSLSMATTLIANSNYYRHILRSQGYYSHKINPGLLFKRNVNRKKKLNQNKITFGYLGRIEEEKGLRLLLHAFGELLAIKHDSIEVYLLVAGDGSMKKEAQALVKNHKLLSNRVLFLGFEPSHYFLNKIDILVNPTTVIAPLEMVNVEAAEKFIPVICFGSYNIPETVIPEKTAIVVRKIDSKNLLYAIQECIAKRLTVDPIAQKNLMHDFSFEIQVKRLRKLYYSL